MNRRWGHSLAGSVRACSRRVRLVGVQVFLYQGCCLYYLQMYKQAAEKVEEFAKREEEQTKARESRQLSQAAVMDRKRDLQRESLTNENKSERLCCLINISILRV